MIIDEVTSMVKHYCQLPFNDINAMLLIHLINQEKDEYLQDYLRYSQDENSNPNMSVSLFYANP